MSLEKLKEVVGEELYKQISPKLEGKNWFFAEGKDYVPKARLDEALASKKEAETQLASRDAQLVELQKSAKGNEELSKQIAELQTSNTKSKEEYEAKILNMQKDYALENALNLSGAKNSKALKGMLDLEKCTFKDGKYEGLDEQISQIKKDNDWLFNTSVKKNVGFEHNKDDDSGKDDFSFYRDLKI